MRAVEVDENSITPGVSKCLNPHRLTDNEVSETYSLCVLIRVSRITKEVENNISSLPSTSTVDEIFV